MAWKGEVDSLVLGINRLGVLLYNSQGNLPCKGSGWLQPYVYNKQITEALDGFNHIFIYFVCKSAL